jgi:hypothetical protein
VRRDLGNERDTLVASVFCDQESFGRVKNTAFEPQSNYTLGVIVNLATDEYCNTKVYYTVCCSFAFDLCHLYDLHSALWLKFLRRSTHGMLPLGETPI